MALSCHNLKDCLVTRLDIYSFYFHCLFLDGEHTACSIQSETMRYINQRHVNRKASGKENSWAFTETRRYYNSFSLLSVVWFFFFSFLCLSVSSRRIMHTMRLVLIYKCHSPPKMKKREKDTSDVCICVTWQKNDVWSRLFCAPPREIVFIFLNESTHPSAVAAIPRQISARFF